MKPIIRVENLGKEYRIGARQASYSTLRETIGGALRAPLKRLGRNGHQEERVWALKDVGFEVMPGEVVGIIGRNGAGKSTLLKILSRITEPTTGRVELYGRVGSLLEVGTGFHPELSGRENIFLNGAVLGMSRAEITRKFDEIVAFAEIDKFLDTPVKRYSSGMYVRLAFAVAAHLEPEILLVDEVLAVGDVQFQKKCLGKMEDIGREGRTVLFVSHNLSAVASLCTRALLVRHGSLAMSGSVRDVIPEYVSSSIKHSGVYHREESRPSGKLEINKISLLKNNIPSSSFYNSETLVIRIEYTVNEKISGAQIALEISTELDECIFSSTNQDWDGLKEEARPGRHMVECPVTLSMFREGRYHLQVSSSVPAVETLDAVPDQLAFEVYDDSSPILKLGQNRRGVILPVIQWKKYEKAP